MGKKVPVSAILHRADEVAKKAGITREEAVHALTIAHEKLGIEIDLGAPAVSTDLNFVNGNTIDMDRALH